LIASAATEPDATKRKALYGQIETSSWIVWQ
jgi:hypothetical protein